MMQSIVSCGKAAAFWRPAVYSDQDSKMRAVDKVCCVARYWYMSVFSIVVSTRFLAHNVTVHIYTMLLGVVLAIAIGIYEYFRARRFINQRIEHGLQQEYVPQNIFNALAQEPSTVLALTSTVDFSKRRSDQGLTLLETILDIDQQTKHTSAESLHDLTFLWLSKLTAPEFLLTLQRSSKLATLALRHNHVDLNSFTDEQKAQCREYAVTPELRRQFVLRRIIKHEG